VNIRELCSICVAGAFPLVVIAGCRGEERPGDDPSRKTEHLENTRRVSEEDELEQRERTERTVAPRFEHRLGESREALLGRADAAIGEIEREIMTLEAKNALLRNNELTDEIADVRRCTIEARKQLESVRARPNDLPLDDRGGRLASAIDEARDELEEAREELAQTPGQL
jgi:hypothetical protein